MGVKIYMCDRIERLPFYSAELDNNDEVVPKSGKSWLSVSNASGQFSEESSDTNAGTLVTQKLDINCDLSVSESNEMAQAPHVFRLRFSDDTVHVWGTPSLPATHKSIKGMVLQKQVSFERQTTQIEF